MESNNWIRDVSFGVDGVKTKAGNQAQVIGLLRGLAIKLTRKTMPKNLRARHRKICGFTNTFANQHE